MATDKNPEQDILAQARSLSDEAYLLLQLVAVLYEPVSTSFLCRAFLSLDHYLLGERRPRYDEVQVMISHLRQQDLLSSQNQCPPVLAELLVRESIKEKRFTRLVAFVEQSTPMEYQHGRWQVRCWRALRQFRIGIYSQNSEVVEEALSFLQQAECRQLFTGVLPAARILTCAFDPAWFAAMPVYLQFFLLDHIIQAGIARLVHAPAIQNYLEQEVTRRIGPEEQVPFLRLLAKLYIIRGEASALDELVGGNTEIFAGTGLRGTVVFLQGKVDKAYALFKEDLDLLARLLDNPEPTLFGLPGFFYVVTQLRMADEAGLRAAQEMLVLMLGRAREGAPEVLPLRCLAAYAAHLLGEKPDLLPLSSALAAEEDQASLLLSLIIFYWLGVEIAPEFLGRLERLQHRAAEQGYCWLAREAAHLLTALGSAQLCRQTQQCPPAESSPNLCNLFKPAADWQHSLTELIEAVHAVHQPDPCRRLSWFVSYTDGELSLIAKDQRRNAQGRWSAGRTISPARLAAGDQPYYTRQDQQLRAALVRTSAKDGAAGDGFVFDPERALPALIGHPLVFLQQSPKTPVEIISAEPELMVERRGDSLFLHFTHPLGEASVSVWPETATRFKVVRIREEHRRVAAITGPRGLQVPVSASAEVLSTIGRLASFMTVHSAIDMPANGEELEEVQGDPTPHIHIIPFGSGFRIELFVRPFTSEGPYLKPGIGAANLIAEIGGKRLKARRNLNEEESRAHGVEESCPMLDLATDFEVGQRREWHLQEPDACLQVLLELDAIRRQVVLEWPEGEKLSIRGQAGTAQLNLNIRSAQQDWFALSGKVQIDEGEVVELKFLLEKARQSKSRFIPLGDGQFLALTQEFRNRLDELLYYGSMDGAGKQDIRVHALAAIALDDLSRQANTEAEPLWRQRQEALETLQDRQFKIPATLKAELRDYQKEGFVWMSRLAALGFGACLADDMGLGKTLQALALILSRAKDGPSLVVAPTSVCMNWQAEICRFAPTLSIQLFSDLPRGRGELSFHPHDVLICSYTLLQQEKKLVAGVNWQTIVLDEAQAIKNAATKRSQAAMQLKGAFRLITTGTPIENHLGELWNLFAFINPGLLGSFKQFNRRFGIPIEKYRDRGARKMLKKLIRPFLLRRIKAEVLDELPPRTEVTLRVELSRDERHFYEALRQQALENIESGKDQAVRQIRILAEIMRLRRACCNPKLVDSGTEIASSKEQAFSELLDELLGGGHKALVFSQFTGHLGLLRRHLDQKKINYCYLDGSTAAAQRRNQVEAFQSGEAALFLISLKAGGLGLNLTAADYVIHMDPWWNPAMEDQAADRAHRIGQKRPVTVYRLVTANTIEEKIVRLHQEKRDLAHSLLEGTDVSARIGVEELLELIRGQ